MNYVPSSTDAKRLSELLDKACSLIITLEGYIIDADSDYDETPCAKAVHELFGEIDMLNFHPHEDTDPEVQNTIDEAMGFIQRLKADPAFAAQWGYDDLGPEYDSAGFTEDDRIVDGQYRTYVDQVKQNIDKATAEGILRDDCTEGYSVMSKETWLRMQADQQAQDWDIFGEKKV